MRVAGWRSFFELDQTTRRQIELFEYNAILISVVQTLAPQLKVDVQRALGAPDTSTPMRVDETPRTSTDKFFLADFKADLARLNPVHMDSFLHSFIWKRICIIGKDFLSILLLYSLCAVSLINLRTAKHFRGNNGRATEPDSDKIWIRNTTRSLLS